MQSLLKRNHTGFVPQALRRGTVMKWLKRTHAWLGLWGALLGLLFGVSGFLMNHRAVLKINAAVPIESTTKVLLPEAARSDSKAFVQWFTDYTHASSPPRLREQPAKKVIWNDRPVEKPAEWTVNVMRPSYALSATYTRGNAFVEVKRSEQNLWGMLGNLHRGAGLGPGWVLLADTLAGGLVVLSLTGFLLWSQLHGPRLVALGLIAAALGWAVLALMPG